MSFVPALPSSSPAGPWYPYTNGPTIGVQFIHYTSPPNTNRLRRPFLLKSKDETCPFHHSTKFV